MTDPQILKVLIVDDYDMTRTLLKIILRGQRFNVVGEADDGELGVQMCEKMKPDIVLLDVIMPKMNGLDALTRIKAQQHQPMVLMVSSAEESDILEEAMKRGANGYILKPFNTDTVIETLNQARSSFIVRQAATIVKKS